MEYIDIFDSSMKTIRSNFKRGERIPTGGYYLVTEVWTVTNDGHILVTLRSPEKKSEPNKWENTGGAVMTGESSKTAAVRELNEETGISISEYELVHISTHKGYNLFVDTFFLRKDVDLKCIRLQKGETVDAKLVEYEELKRMIDEGVFSASIAERLSFIQDAFYSFLKQSSV